MDIRSLGPGDAAVVARVASGVFDHDPDPDLTREFLRDDRHHLVVAVDDGVVVGFVSGLHYVHPDKPPELWINEVGVAPSHQRRGLAKEMLRTIFDIGVELGCREAWILTDRSNTSAMRLYNSLDGNEDPDDTVMFTFRLPAREAEGARGQRTP